MFIAALFVIAKMKTSQISTKRLMDKHVVVYLYRGILLSIEKDQTTETYSTIDESQADYAE